MLFKHSSIILVFEEKVLVVSGEGFSVGLLCKDWRKLAEEETICSSPLQGQQLGANLLVIPQIVKLAGKLCITAAGANWSGMLAGPHVAAVRRSSFGLLQTQLAALCSSWRSRGRRVREKEEGTCWSFDYLIRGESVTLTNSSSKLNFSSRCEEWGILGHWVQFRVHFEIHNKWLHQWVPTSPPCSQAVAWRGILRAPIHMYNP